MSTQLKKWNGEDIYPNVVVTSRTHKYAGEKIDLSELGYDFSKDVNLSGAYTGNTQGCVCFGNYIFIAQYASSNAKLLVFNRTSGVYLSAVNLNTNVHCNSLTFGSEYYGGNTEFPVLYASEWDGQKRYFVFNLVRNSDTSWNASLVQTIQTSSVSSDSRFGAGNSDVCIDASNGFMYTISYKKNSYDSATSGNMYSICKFALPKLSAGSSVTLAASGILDSFEVKCYSARQDFCYHQGKIYLLAGLGKNQTTVADKQTYLIVIDTEKKIIANEIIIDHLNSAIEPEGIFVEKGKLYCTFQGGTALYRFDF